MKKWELNKITKMMYYWLKEQKVFYHFDAINRFYEEEKYDDDMDENEIYDNNYSDIVLEAINTFIKSKELLKRKIEMKECYQAYIG